MNSRLLCQDTIHVVEAKSTKHYGEHFMRQILKVLIFLQSKNVLLFPIHNSGDLHIAMQFEEVISQMDRVKLE